MSAQIDLKDLSSFFELFVAYTFAYNSLDSFKKSVNKLSVRDLDDKTAEYTEKVKSERQKVNDLLVINNYSSDLNMLLTGKLERLNDVTIHMNNLSKVANVFYSGDFLKPMFYLTGAIYLFYIVLCPFQKLLGDTCIILIINSITISVLIYYIIYFFNKIMPYRKFDFKKIEWVFKTKKTLKRFGVVVFLITIISCCISKYIHANYPELKKAGDKVLINFMPMTSKDCYQTVSIIGIISLALVPYIVYYFREHLILKKIEPKIEEATKQFNELFNEIQLISKVSTQSVLSGKISSFNVKFYSSDNTEMDAHPKAPDNQK